MTPEEAFDELYASCAPTLVRQTYLLTGRHALALESVERAFRHAWHRWPEVALDPDPPSWVRAAAYDHALSPWRRRRRCRREERAWAAIVSSPADRALLAALAALPPRHRRTLLLHDGLGLDLPGTAAETEASTAAATARLRYAREAVAAASPEFGDPGTLRLRMAETARAATSTTRPRPPRPPVVRRRAERVARWWTGAAVAVAAVLGTLVTTGLVTAATRYEPPAPEGERARVAPVPGAPGPSPGAGRTRGAEPEGAPAAERARVPPRAG
ncbi:RNA polymerase subunit sigma-70 [Streptomyces sp. MJP52]|uniref:RNA polymerase subunit sigma-70 n=1 Tax=Streptomyces sp. MJP52 TaxID=2940555 RepID=UPI00247CBB43|nr:DNA-directed RNA polymerase specialized sigma24 family protein [Streptomyces sp. MJP52]